MKMQVVMASDLQKFGTMSAEFFCTISPEIRKLVGEWDEKKCRKFVKKFYEINPHAKKLVDKYAENKILVRQTKNNDRVFAAIIMHALPILRGIASQRVDSAIEALRQAQDLAGDINKFAKKL